MKFGDLSLLKCKIFVSQQARHFLNLRNIENILLEIGAVLILFKWTISFMHKKRRKKR